MAPASSEDGGGAAPPEALRSLPSVESLASQVPGPHHLRVAEARIEIERARRQIRSGGPSVPIEELIERVTHSVDRSRRSNLRPVINATGIVLHTNLGRAPLAPEAAAQAALVASSYSTLEYDLESGERGSRHRHLNELLCGLSGAEAAIAVNNNAAAVMLAVAATTGSAAARLTGTPAVPATGLAQEDDAQPEVIIGRDQLIEIGGSFRIPEIISGSGARLVEVGTTNRVRIGDYESAIGPRTCALMRVHQSNFETVGFTESVEVGELAALGREHSIPVIDDLGSGATQPLGAEPQITASVEAGADLCCFSGDKLLGGPQAGIIVGSEVSVERCRRHPLARALRLDKLQLAALEATLQLHRDRPDAIPALVMMAPAGEDLARRAKAMARIIGPAAHVKQVISRAGGGTLPTYELPGPACLVDPGSLGADGLARALRLGEPPTVVRISEASVALDPRTMSDAEAELAAEAVADALD